MAKDNTGQEREFSRGDKRPIRTILRGVEYDANQIKHMEAELELRSKMIEQDFFPLNPDPVGCMICEAESFCRRFDIDVSLKE